MADSKPYADHAHAPRWMRERLRVLRLIERRISDLKPEPEEWTADLTIRCDELLALREAVEGGCGATEGHAPGCPAADIEPPETEAPHWEFGYRCHGYWLGSDRLGAVSYGPPIRPIEVYRWIVDATREEGQEPTLRKAKRAVERRVRGN